MISSFSIIFSASELLTHTKEQESIKITDNPGDVNAMLIAPE